MKKRLEDQLIELAFDFRQDSIPAEIAADPAAHQRLSEYRTMKSALGQLREVPEHQLSTERLREALLHQGLKRRFQFPWQATAYGTFALTLFVCGFFATKILRTPHQIPQINTVDNSMGIAAKPDSADMKLWLAPSQVNVPNTKSIVAVAPRHHHAHQKLVIGVTGGDLVLNDHKRDNFVTSAPGHEVDAMLHGKTAPISEMRDGDNQLPSKPISPAGKVQDAIVVIRQGTDSDTGLDTAQEDHSKNVLVSG